MNLEPSQDYREQMEVRIVAWLLGEASDFESAELQQAMQKDPALAEFHAQMQRTVGLVREVSKKAVAGGASNDPQPGLSAERRRALFDRFNQAKVTVVPAPQPIRRRHRYLVPLSLAASLVVLLGGAFVYRHSTYLGKSKGIAFSIAASAPKQHASAPMPQSRQVAGTEITGVDNLGIAPGVVVDKGEVALADLPSQPAAPPKIFLPSASSESTTTSAGVSEVREQVAEKSLAPLNLKLPVPAFMGVPTDLVSSPSGATSGNGPATAARPEGRSAPSTSADVSLGFAYSTTTSPSDRNDNLATPTPAQSDIDIVRNSRRSAKSDGFAAGRSGGGGIGGAQATAGGFAVSNSGNLAFDDNTGVAGGPSSSVETGGKANSARGDQFGAYSLRGNQGDDSGRPLERFQALADAGTRTAGLSLDQENQTRNRQDSERQKVPVLGEVPLLGRLYNNRSVPAEDQGGRTRLVQQQEARKLSEGPPEGASVKKPITPVPTAPAPAAAPAALVQRVPVASPAAPPSIALADANGVVSMPLDERLPESKESAAKEELLVRGTEMRAKELASALVKAKKEITFGEGGEGEGGFIGGGVGGLGRSGAANAGETYFQLKRQQDKLMRQQEAIDIIKRVQEMDQASQDDLKTGKLLAKRGLDTEGSSAPQKPPANLPLPQPEVSTRDNPYSTFSLNVSDVSFKLSEASLANGAMPDPASIRVEEFVNAFNYRDPAPPAGAPLAFAWERAHDPFAHNRDILRFSIQTAVVGRELNKPLNLVILLDNSGSMERPDRVQILREALLVLAQQLHPQDRISVIAFARTARLWVDGMPGGNPRAFLAKVLDLNPEGGTNLEEAMNLGYATAVKHFMANGMNRVILLTDGAANLGNVDPEQLKLKVIAHRQKGIALDCFGIGWEGYNDDLLEILSHNGDGRYGFLNQPEQAAPEFANQLAGALNVAAADVKTQVEFNPRRVAAWRQIGYARHQLTKEQFRDNTVDAAEIAAAESGNALYVVEINPQGSGPIGMVRVRYKVPATGEYFEQEWPIPFQPRVAALDQASPAMRLAATAAVFGEWLARSPYADAVRLADMPQYLGGVAEVYAPDPRPARLAWMIRQAQSLTGK